MTKAERRVLEPDKGGIIAPQYALEFFNALKAKAGTETVDGEEYTVFRGGITKEYDELGFSRAHYGRVVKTLENIGAIQVIQKGNPRQQSAIVLYDDPDLATLSEAYHLTRPSEQRKMTADTLAGRVESLERRVGTDIDYTKVLINIEARLQALERKAEDGS